MTDFSKDEYDIIPKLKEERDQLKGGINKLQSNVRNQKAQREKAHDEKEKIDAFNLNKSKKQLSQGLKALSHNVKKVKFQKDILKNLMLYICFLKPLNYIDWQKV
jgi:hypothetical protein